MTKPNQALKSQVDVPPRMPAATQVHSATAASHRTTHAAASWRLVSAGLA